MACDLIVYNLLLIFHIVVTTNFNFDRQPRSSYEILDFQLAQSAEISASTTDYSGANNLAETKLLLKIGQLVARKVYKQWESLLVSVCFS